MTAIFITASGTHLGKTFVTAGLIRHLRREGKPVEAVKPVVSGFDPADMAGSDPGRLLAALGKPINLDEIARISPWRYRAPLSPEMAAIMEGGRLDYDAVVDFCRNALAASRSTLFIEGIGGLMVPLDESHTVLDLMQTLEQPLILVTGSYLGTLSHTLTALEVIRRCGLTLVAVVVSETPGSLVPLADTVATIQRFALPAGTITLPRLASATDDHPAFAEIMSLL